MVLDIAKIMLHLLYEKKIPFEHINHHLSHFIDKIKLIIDIYKTKN